MKIKIGFLVLLIVFCTSVGWSVESLDVKEELRARIHTIQAQHDALEDLIGKERAYSGYADKSIQKVMDALEGEEEGSSIHFLEVLKNSCNLMDKEIDKGAISLNELLGLQRKKIEDLNFGIAQLIEKEEEEPKGGAGISAIASSKMPSKEEVFKTDFRLHPDFGEYLDHYLVFDDLAEFFNAQAPLQIQYGVDFIENDQRFPAIFGAGGREYKKDARYIWRNFMEIVMNRFHGGGAPSDGSFNPYAEKLKYNDVWAINACLAKKTHNKKTQDAYRYFKSSGVQKAETRALGGLGFKK